MPQLEFSPEELSAIREEYAKGATDAQFTNFISECSARSLRPGVHVVLQIRNATEWDPILKAKINVKKSTKITTIEAFRIISERTGLYEGVGETEYHYLDAEFMPSIMSKIPLPDPKNPSLPREPWAVCVPIYRRGFREPVRIMARFEAYAGTKVRDGVVELTDIWLKRGCEMTAKCAEVAGRRVAFPEVLGSMYLAEEFKAEEESIKTPEVPTVVVPVPRVAVVPVVDHTPAQPTNAARPGHEAETLLSKSINEALSASLDKVEALENIPSIVVEEEKPKRTRKPRAEAIESEQSESHVIVGGNSNTTPIATDDDLPATMFEDEGVRKMDKSDEEMMHNALVDNRLPNKAEGTEIAVKVRSYYAHVANKDLQTYILKTAGKVYGSDITAPAQIPMRVWTEVFAKMDTELEKGGKAALVNLVTL